jgi:hypothetical protein
MIDKTISTLFIVPTLKLPSESKDNGFINGYKWDMGKQVNYENAVYLLFKPKNIDKFKEFVDDEYIRGEHTNSPLIEDYDYEGGFVVLVYTLDPDFKDDFDKVKKGKYSRTSDEFKELFSKIVMIVEKGYPREKQSLQWRIFNKTDDLRVYWEDKLAVDFTDDMEVWEGWDEKKEILNIEEIKVNL